MKRPIDSAKYVYKESDKMLKIPKDYKPVTKNLPDKKKVIEYFEEK